MLIIFGNTILGGEHNAVAASPQVEIWRSKWPGLAGETELVGRCGGRPVHFMQWTYPYGTWSGALAAWSTFESWIGMAGQVTQVATTGESIVWDEMTLISCPRVPVPPHDGPGPYASIGGTFTGYWMAILWSFYQTLPASQDF